VGEINDSAAAPVALSHICCAFLAPPQAAGYHGQIVDEPALIREAQRGELEAFNRLVLAYQSLAFNVALRIMGEEASAADATQEAFISAFRALRRYRGGSFRAWLLRIVTNACYDELRRRKRRPATSIDAMEDVQAEFSLRSPDESPEQAAERSELAQAIQDCLMLLVPEFRTVAVLVDVQGFNYQEAAAAIGKPLGTVKSRLARARARLRDCLKGHGELLPASYRLGSRTA
jgi:RNA polymerase sigma-70 factor (ECF subfamily)